MTKKTKLLSAMAIGAAALAAGVGLAGTLSVPNSFSPGTAISSAQVNANFSAVQTAVNGKQDAMASGCSAGSALQSIAQDGTATCAAIPPPAAFGLTLAGSSSNPGLSVTNDGLGTAIYGASDGGTGVWGQTNSLTGSAGVVAMGADNAHPALTIAQGGLRVAGAGVGTPTAAFTVVANSANTFAYTIHLDNPLTNGNPGAILIVTHNLAASNDVQFPYPVGVDYGTTASGNSIWFIYREDLQNIPIGTAFNVLVITP